MSLSLAKYVIVLSVSWGYPWLLATIESFDATTSLNSGTFARRFKLLHGESTPFSRLNRSRTEIR